MQRRKFLVGLGATVSGSATAVGTGAFTSVEADRTVDVEVAGDSDAYLGLLKAANEDDSGNINDPGANSDAYVKDAGAEVSFDFSSNNTTTDLGDGFNPNAVTVVEDLIEVQNQGTQDVFLSVDLADLDLTDSTGTQAGIELAVSNPDDASSNADAQQAANIAFDSSGGSNDPVGNAQSPSSYQLGKGEAVHLDLTVDTTNFADSNVSNTNLTGQTVTFIADQSSSL